MDNSSSSSSSPSSVSSSITVAFPFPLPFSLEVEVEEGEERFEGILEEVEGGFEGRMKWEEAIIGFESIKEEEEVEGRLDAECKVVEEVVEEE